MDLNPDQMIVAGKVKPASLVARTFEFFNRLTLRRAAAVVVLDRYMADRVVAKWNVADRLMILPPWPHVSGGDVAAADIAAFRARHGLEGKFVVMYSGNHAIQHPLDTLLAAADRLAGESRIRFVFIGGGAGKAAVERRVSQGAANILSLPFQPLEHIGESLSAADLHVVSMGGEVVGIVHPCKIYGALAVGRPVLFFGPDRSHGGDLLRESDIGWRVDHGDVAAAITAITRASEMSAARLTAMGNRAADLVASRLSREFLLARFCDAVEQVVRC
jgi:glycosyltransferase involved in cell wall biosynthesis